jgi:hypothetical protein
MVSISGINQAAIMFHGESFGEEEIDQCKSSVH